METMISGQGHTTVYPNLFLHLNPAHGFSPHLPLLALAQLVTSTPLLLNIITPPPWQTNLHIPGVDG